MMFRFSLFIILFILLAACAPAALDNKTSVAVKQDASLGSYLIAENGLTLYTFARDGVNTSNCAADCLATWPPFLVDKLHAPAGLNGSLGTLQRSDGGQQLSYNKQPLYFFAGVSEPDDVNGHGVGGVWYVARVTAATASRDTDNETSSSNYGY